jgi:hypothetical protein
MTRLGLRRPTPSIAVSLTALVIAMGGTSYAVTKLPSNSVGTKQLKRNAVATADIKANAINSSKVKDRSLTGRDIAMASLGQVPLAARAALADRAATVDRAALAGGLDRVVYRVATVAIAPAPSPTESATGVATARCDAGQLVVGGGVKLDENMSVVDAYPEGAAAWTVHAHNDDPLAPHNFTTYAICITATTPG